ncbi:MAG: hypothetical protein ACOZF0_19750 [Thermodesulfobacteriota bacterium]
MLFNQGDGFRACIGAEKLNRTIIESIIAQHHFGDLMDFFFIIGDDDFPWRVNRVTSGIIFLFLREKISVIKIQWLFVHGVPYAEIVNANELSSAHRLAAF